MFKIGDRVVFKRGKVGSTVETLKDYIQEAEIIETSNYSLNKRYKIKTNNKTVSNRFVETWVSSSEIDLDKSYYRNLKIKSIIND